MVSLHSSNFVTSDSTYDVYWLHILQDVYCHCYRMLASVIRRISIPTRNQQAGSSPWRCGWAAIPREFLVAPDDVKKSGLENEAGFDLEHE
jgi:hypothetical protein